MYKKNISLSIITLLLLSSFVMTGCDNPNNNNIQINPDNIYEESKLYRNYGMTYAIEGGEASIVGYHGNSKKVYVPEAIKHEGKYYNVTSLKGAFIDNKFIEEVYIPDCVTFISSSSFANCSNLKKVRLSNSLTSIESQTFYNCTNLTDIDLPNKLEIIKILCFNNCSNLVTINIPNTVSDIERYAFLNCDKLKDVNIPDSLTKINPGVFSGTSIEVLMISPYITKIYSNAFSFCPNLISITVDPQNDFYTSLDNSNAIIEKSSNKLILGCKNTVIPDSVTSIGGDAFAGCKDLNSIHIGKNVTNISNNAFEDCSSLTNITVDEENEKYDSRDNSNAIIDKNDNTLIVGGNNSIIPEGVTSIGQYAFSGRNIESLDLDSTDITSIYDYAYSNCDNLTSVKLSNVVEYGSGVFYNCDKLKNVQLADSLRYITPYMFGECSSLEVFNFPTSLESISYDSFTNCGSLKSINIPSSTTSFIENPVFSLVEKPNPFEGCYSLEEIIVEEGNEVFDSRDNSNAIIDKESNTLIVACKNTIIPSSVSSVTTSAFYSVDVLNEVTMNNDNYQLYKNVENINKLILDDTFNQDFTYLGCVDEIVIEEGNERYELDNNSNALMEKDNSKLVKATGGVISSNVKTIASNAFKGCIESELISIPNTVEVIEGYAYRDNNNLQAVIISGNVKTIYENSFDNDVAIFIEGETSDSLKECLNNFKCKSRFYYQNEWELVDNYPVPKI